MRLQLFQLLRFIVSGDAINFMHTDINMENIYIRCGENVRQVKLAVGNFSGAQNGELTVSRQDEHRNAQEMIPLKQQHYMGSAVTIWG